MFSQHCDIGVSARTNQSPHDLTATYQCKRVLHGTARGPVLQHGRGAHAYNHHGPHSLEDVQPEVYFRYQARVDHGGDGGGGVAPAGSRLVVASAVVRTERSG